MSNTKVDISLKSKGDPTVNLTIIEAPEISESSSSSPVINFITTGAQGPTGVQGQDGVAEISTGQITSDHLSSNSVGQDEIANGSVTYNKLASSSVRGNRISSSAITSSKIANGAVTQSKLAQNSVGTDQIINGTITAELLQDLTIIGDKLEDLGISTGKLQDLIITTAKLRDRNVTGIKIAENADLDGEIKVHNLKLKGYSPAVITGPDSDALHIKSNQTIDFLNSSGVTIATLDQNGNLSISGTVDGRDIASDGVKLDGIADNEIIDWTTDQGSVNINPGNYTDTVYTHPSSHPISLIAGLQTSLNSKTTLSAFNAAVSGLQSDIDAKQDAIGNEDLTIQQTDGLQDALNGKVDDSQVLTNVPANAVFTDTVYTHPTNHAISVITGLQSALDAKQDGIGSEDLTIAMTDGLQDALNAKVDDSQVLTNVPANAVFTDTNTTYSIQDGELSQNNFTNADHTKLNGIEANATADQTQADINALGITAVGIAGPTDGDVLISTDGSISVILDNDNDESNQYFEVRNSATGVIFLVNENGNVDVGGTVDGRDVSADGTKLDGIENGATADQTKADIDALGISASSAISLTVGNKTIVGNLIITGTVDGIDIATDVAANTLKTSFPGFGTTAGTALEGSTTIPTQYTDALAVHAVENATLTLDNDLTVDSGFIYIHDQASTAKSRIGTETLTGNQTVYLPDASGTMALTNKTIQQFNLSFADDIGSTQHYLSWRDQYEQSNISSDLTDTNYLVPANGRVKCVYMRVGTRVYSRTMTVRVYSQNAGFLQSQVQQESEATSISSSDDFEVFAFYFDNAEHFQAGDSIKISVQDSADSGNTQIYHVTAVLEFDYTQMGRTTSGELA